ncbi:unnamed protein product [Sphagnum troendelagicum]
MRFREGLEQNCAQESLVFEVGISSRRSTKLCAVRCGVEVSISLLFEPRLTASEWISISPSRKLYAVRCGAEVLISLLFEAQLRRTFQQSFPQALRTGIKRQPDQVYYCKSNDDWELCLALEDLEKTKKIVASGRELDSLATSEGWPTSGGSVCLEEPPAMDPLKSCQR